MLASQRKFMPILRKMTAMPVSWQIGRFPSDLGNRILGRRAFLALIGSAQSLNVINGMVVADELEGIGNALNQVFLTDSRHVGFRFVVIRGNDGSLHALELAQYP
jgi:hypothetical protein